MNSRKQERHDAPKVLTSLEDADGFRCVDIFVRPDGTYGFKEYRRDPEDAGRWTLINDFSRHSYSTRDEARNAVGKFVAWFKRQ